jgi:hypothetical protein
MGAIIQYLTKASIPADHRRMLARLFEPEARAVLSEFDEHVSHYEVVQ